ncbi:hypothetical protein FBY34_2401 [Streptomyces sp. SLBN-115]|nr:hypothetical protein FBY34_2401 [Streptomyces sp. SLBN-115]
MPRERLVAIVTVVTAVRALPFGFPAHADASMAMRRAAMPREP